MKFTKPELSNKDHLQLLRNRGLIVDDEENLTAALNQIGYFRLSGYMFPFQSRDGDHTFHAGVSSTAILRHYAFDKKLRIILLESIESLEVALRAEVCNRTSIEWGSHWYIDKHYFNNPDWHNDLVNSVNKSVDKGNEQFIRSYRNKYDTPSLPPIWMAMEVISFGELSSMYDNLKDGDVKKLVAGKFGVHDAFLSSWLKSINFVRNCCAHHNRLWN
ncbi:MAG TPA: Abi family protein, partial [Bacteroidia bacterium]|nr:Abi family protein [Bacteroidia bacterium]